MDKLWRSIVHDVAEVASLVSFSFGEEGYDKYIMVFKSVSGGLMQLSD